MKTFKTLRKEHGYSQTELAQKIGISQQSIANYEKGKSKPGSAVLEKIAKIFSVSPDEISFDESEDEQVLRLPRPDLDSQKVGIATAYFLAWLEVNEIQFEPKEVNGIKGLQVIYNEFPEKKSCFIRWSQFVNLRDNAVKKLTREIARAGEVALLDKESVLKRIDALPPRFRETYKELMGPVISNLENTDEVSALDSLWALKTGLDHAIIPEDLNSTAENGEE